MEAMDSEADSEVERARNRLQRFFDRNRSPRKQAFKTYVLEMYETLNQHSRLPYLRSQTPGTAEYGESHLLPPYWTNNNAEAINSTIKRKCNYQPQEFKVLVKILSDLMDLHHKDTELAVTQRGRWVLSRRGGVAHMWMEVPLWNDNHPGRRRRIKEIFAAVEAKRPKKRPINLTEGVEGNLVAATEGRKRKPGQAASGSRSSRTKPRGRGRRREGTSNLGPTG